MNVMKTENEIVPSEVGKDSSSVLAQMGVAEHPFLKSLGARHLKTLADCAMQTSFAEGSFIFSEGEIADRFYLIQEGSVRLETTDNDEIGIVPIQIIGLGQVLGWSWMFAPCFWRFSARAMEPVAAIAFYAPKLRQQCELDHDLGYELMKRTAEVALDRLQATYF